MERQNAPEPVETETISVQGKDVTIEKALDNTIAVRLPEGLDPDEKDKFIRSVEEGSKLVGAWYRKNQEANEKERTLAEREAQLAEREKALSTGKTNPEPAEEIMPIWKRLGLKSEADEDDYAIDNPAKYQKAMREFLQEEARITARKEYEAISAKTQQLTQDQHLERRIKEAGADPENVKAFAQYYNMPYSDKAFDLYARQHALKTDPIIDAQLEAQRKQVKWIEPGDQREIQSIVSKFKTNPDSLSEAELDLLIETRKKQFKN